MKNYMCNENGKQYTLVNKTYLFFCHQEEIAKLQRKLERSKKIEMAGAADEVLMAEIAEYKVSGDFLFDVYFCVIGVVFFYCLSYTRDDGLN